MADTPLTTVKTRKAMKRLLRRIYPSGKPAPEWEHVSIDTEYDPALPPKEMLAFVQLSNGKERIVIDGPLTSKARGKVGYFLPLMLKQWVRDRRVKKRVSSFKADFRALRDAGCGELAGVEFDTEVGDWMSDENRFKHGLKDCARDHCDIYMKSYGDTFGYHPPKKDGTPQKKRVDPSMSEIVFGREKYPHIPWTGAEGRLKATRYAGNDPYGTHRVSDHLIKDLKGQGLWEWYYTVERPFTRVLVEMEDRGIRINREEVSRVHDILLKENARTLHTIRAITDEPTLNLNSNPQKQKLIFEKLGWPVVARNPPTDAMIAAGLRQGNPSLDAAAMEVYAEEHGFELARLMLDYQRGKTLFTTFICSILEKLKGGNILYSVFHQAKVKTGRLSSGNSDEGLMNFQNIPASKEKDPYGLRAMFWPLFDDYVLIVGDYSQVELFLLAQLSLDPEMILAFNSGEDLHCKTAASVFGLKDPGNDPDAIEAFKEKYGDERKASKVINFGIPYGMAEGALSGKLDVSKEKAKKYLLKYMEKYKGVARYIRRTVKFAKENGFVLTIGGRRLHVPEINSDSFGEAGHAERRAVNGTIQGSAADLIKVAMNHIHYGSAYGQRCKWTAPVKDIDSLKRYRYEMLIQVHDEIVGQAPKKDADKSVALVKAAMESSFRHFFKNVTLKASVHAGSSWAEGKK